METFKNENGDKVTLYFARYGYKKHTVVYSKLLYEGNINTCPENLLAGVEFTPNHKFVRIWIPR